MAPPGGRQESVPSEDCADSTTPTRAGGPLCRHFFRRLLTIYRDRLTTVHRTVARRYTRQRRSPDMGHKGFNRQWAQYAEAECRQHGGRRGGWGGSSAWGGFGPGGFG